jgi:DNA-binding transcriptional LysR family regulator
VRLLQRTTRSVSPTLDGEAYYRRCIAIIDDVEDAEGAFGGTKPKGMLRIEVQGTLARHFLMPGLPDFFAHYPDIEITMSEGDRYVDIVREGVDCVVRFGALPDSDMVARRIGLLRRMTYASPGYIARLGSPADIDALSGHRMVGLRRLTTGALEPLQFTVADKVCSVMLAAPMSVSGPESYILSARLGLGLLQPFQGWPLHRAAGKPAIIIERRQHLQPSCFCDRMKAAQASRWASSELKACSSPSSDDFRV